ncbi:MAG: putative aminopeptidase [Candidatus Azotimanducaceae bacterium]
MRHTKIILLCFHLCLLTGCEHLGYYNQAVTGHLGIMFSSQPVEALLDDPQTPQVLRQQLLLAEKILQYAEVKLLLDADGKYGRYVQLKDDYVVWNVFAAQPVKLRGETWCYPVAGCAPYKGFYAKEDALAFADKYQHLGFETYVGGVSAYSTLGWFNDPLLSSFIHYQPLSLAELLFHELAHSKVWVPGSVSFNESFASFVGRQGAWEYSQSALVVEPDAYTQWLEQKRQWQVFKGFALQIKADLEEIYAGVQGQTKNTAEIFAQRQRYLVQIQSCYEKNKVNLGGGRYDNLMRTRLNNAFLVSLGTYEDFFPAFEQLFRQSQRDWGEFYMQVAALAKLSAQERTAKLAQLLEAASAMDETFSGGLGEQQVAAQANDNNAEQVHCDAFSNHGLN